MELLWTDDMPAALTAFWEHFTRAFNHKGRAAKALEYVTALLMSTATRRNAAQLADTRRQVTPRALQRLLTNTTWSVTRVVQAIQAAVGQLLGEPNGMLIIDDSGFPRQGRSAAGVAKQYCSGEGRVTVCQVGVFLSYRSPRGHTLVDARLYLPEEWTTDTARRVKAQMPADVPFRTKIALALGMVQAAKRRNTLPAHWVLADETYGRSQDFRTGIADAGYWYLVEVPANSKVALTPHPPQRKRRSGRAPQGPRRVQVRALATATPASSWTMHTIGESSHGPRCFQFSVRRVWEAPGRSQVGRAIWLIIRRNPDGTAPRYFYSNAPATVPEVDVLQVVGCRWGIETDFRLLKSELGLNDYEVRSWPGWYHHMVLCMLAGVFLLQVQQEWGKKGARGDATCRRPDGASPVAPALLVAG